MSIFGYKTDYVQVSLNNNGCAFIQIEGHCWDAERKAGERWIEEARRLGYEDRGTIRRHNGDVLYILN